MSATPGSSGGNGPQSFNPTTVSRLQDDLRASKAELAQVSEQIQVLNSRKWELQKKVKDIKSELNLLKENESSMSKFDGDDFPWSEEMMAKLRSVFKIQDFRSHQKAAINATMMGLDLILVMPTGGGKSLCFQLPALLSKGVTLVVSPLISLMEDQLQGLKSLGVETEILNSSSDRQETKRIYQLMEDPNSKLKLLYITPEKLAKNKLLMPQIEKMYRAGRLSRLVIDEVHCCSQWGHEFRPDYKFLGIMKTQYPKTPIIGLTATVTSNVLVDIQKILNIEGCLVLRDSFYRPNLRYSVKDTTTKEKVQDVADIIKFKFSGQSGIIYCLTVKDCEEVAKQLTKVHKIRCATYHARVEPPEARTDTQRRWSRGEIQVIVATVAFGMGINKLNVRFVLHYSLSKSVENYYQETGRAGRDGLDAECILLYNFSDAFLASSIMMTERNGAKNVYNMLNYALDQVTCRKKLISIHFGDPCEAIENGCDKCDNCEFSSNAVKRKEIKVNGTKFIEDILKILEHAQSLETRMTSLKLMDAWFNKGLPKLRTAAVPIPDVGREICEKFVSRLIVDGYLKEDFHFTPYSTIGYIVPGSKCFIDLPKCLEYTFYETSSPNSKLQKNSKSIKNGEGKTKALPKKRKSKSNSDSTSSGAGDSDEDFQDRSYQAKTQHHNPGRTKAKAPRYVDSDS